MEKITVVKAEPGKPPEAVEIENNLKTLQEMVSGYIEGHGIPGTSFMLFVNEEGRMRGLPLNRRLNNFAFRGTMVIVKVVGSENATMNAEEVAKAKELLS